MIQKIAAVAKEIDDLFLTRPTASSANPFKPVISRFSIENNQVTFQSYAKLFIETRDPQGSDLFYFWRITDGGTYQDQQGNYFYFAQADAGTVQTVTLIVANERGYYTSATITVKIK